MVLNGVQQSSLQAVWEYYRSSFEGVQPNDRNDLLAFLDSLINAEPFQLPSIFSQFLQARVAKEVLGEAQLLMDMFRHPCPQNRTTGDATCGQEPGYVCFWEDGFDTHVLREREGEGIFCLTRDNKPRGQRNPSTPQSHDVYYPDPEAVNRRDVVMFLQSAVGKLVAKLLGLVLQGERLRIAELERELEATRDRLLQADADHGWQNGAQKGAARERHRRHRAGVRVKLEFNKIVFTDRQSKLSRVLAQILRYEYYAGWWCTLRDLMLRNSMQKHGFTCQEVFNVCENSFNEKGPRFEVEEYSGEKWVRAIN